MSFKQYLQAVASAIARQDGELGSAPSASGCQSGSVQLSLCAAAAPPSLPCFAVVPTGPQLRDLVAINSATAQQAVFQARQANPRWNPAHSTSQLPEAWAEFLAFHCACLAAWQDGKRVEAYEKAVLALQPFLKVRRRVVRTPPGVSMLSRLAHPVFPAAGVPRGCRGMGCSTHAQRRAQPQQCGTGRRPGAAASGAAP